MNAPIIEDAFVPPVAVWDECLRVLKPGGHLVAFAGSRTLDRMEVAIRLARPIARTLDRGGVL